MMKHVHFLVVFCVKICLCAVNYTDQIQNYVDLISLYSINNISTKDFLPISDLSSPINVTVDMTMFALNDFDEIAGNVEVAGVLEMSWRDEIALANTGSGFGGFIYSVEKPSFLVPYNKIWTPKLVLSNSVDSISAIGDSAYMCRFHMDTYLVEWSPRMLIRGACSPDVTFYPFDRQSCVFTLVPWGYHSDEILLTNNKSWWDRSSYEENGEWTIVETKTETFVSGTTSNLRLSLTIERKPLYFAFNIILPVLVLCILNSMVFWLPAASGERVGFSITCFLSFVVLLNLIFEILPRSSSPISYLCYYLVVMMVFSGLVTGFVIFEMNAFHKPDDEEVPDWLQKIVRVFTCHRSCKCRQNAVSDKKSRAEVLEDRRYVSTNGVSTRQALHKAEKAYNIARVMQRAQTYPNGKLQAAIDNKLGHTDFADKNERNSIDSDVVHTDTTNKVDRSSTHDSTLSESMETPSNNDKPHKGHQVTWVMVGNFLDKVFFVAFLGAQIFFSTTFLLPLGFRAIAH